MILREKLGISAVTTWLPSARVSAADAGAAESGYAEIAVATGVAPPEMAVLAARRALRKAHLDAATVGLVAHAWIYHQGHDFWSPAHYIASELGAHDAQPVGIQQMCNGAGAALEAATARLLADPSVSAAVVTTADRFCPPGFDRWRGDLGVCYGDGATAAVLRRLAASDALALLSIATSAAPGLEAMHRGTDDFSPAPHSDRATVDVRRTKKAFLGKTGAQSFAEEITSRVRAVITKSLRAADIAADDPRLRCVTLPRLGGKALSDVYIPAVKGVVPADPVDLGRHTGHLGAGDMLANCAALVDQAMLAPGEMALMLSAGAGFTWTCALLQRQDAATNGKEASS